MDEVTGAKKKRSLPAKFIAGFAVGAVLGFGLCGLSLSKSVAGDNWWGRAASVGAGCFFVCILGLIGSAIWLSVNRRGEGR